MLWFLFFIFFHASLMGSNASEILEYIASRHIHSSEDDYLPYEKAKKEMQKRKLRMTCGAISHFTETYLQEHGIKCRFILTLTLDEWNNYNNGHSMIEVFENDHWELWDIDLKKFFMFKDRRVNAKTFCKIQYMPYEIIRFSEAPILPEKDENNWFGIFTSTDEGLRKLYARVCQIPMVRQNGVCYFTCDPKNRKRIESYPYCGPFKYMRQIDFDNKYYLNE